MTEDRRPLALVTGASGGIGADLARELAHDGHDLVLVARTVAALEALAGELSAAAAARCTVLPCDLSEPGAAGRLVSELEGRGLTLDVLVNNAGFGDSGPFDGVEPEKLTRMLMLNVVALTELTRLVLPGMVTRRRGRVMLVASTASFQPCPGMAAYGATKAYVLSLGESIAFELASTGVTVTTLCPGATRTGFAEAAGSANNLLFQSRLVRVMDSAAVARIGYRGLKSGRRVVVTGLMNRVSSIAGRLLPPWATMPLTRALLTDR